MLTREVLFFVTIAPRISLGRSVKKNALQVALVLDINMNYLIKETKVSENQFLKKSLDLESL